VLGQLVTLLDTATPDAALDAIKAAVRAASEGRSFASFHDRVSGPLAPNVEGQAASPRRWSDEEVLHHAYDATDAPLVVELDDHYTDGLFPSDLPHSYFCWEFEPGQFHLIEAVARVRPLGPNPAGGSALSR
jgi:hypothetical protein